MTRPPVRAIIWDFDNTLVDTGARNLSVTRRIIRHVTGREPDDFAPLRDQAAYDQTLHETQDWRELYSIHFGMVEHQIVAAGRLWTRFQRTDATPTTWFPRVTDAVGQLRRFPHGIVSLNTRANIESTLERDGLSSAFTSVVGCGDVPRDRQKPDPEGLMRCVLALVGEVTATVIYVGDHPIDAECAAKANDRYAATGRGVKVVSVAAFYGTKASEECWPVEPRFRASCPLDVVRIVDEVSARGR
ncbi:MAG: HAD-IA family hydrolase [Gemmatimonadota bacterium]|nr:HAD-IA family hydrolase [Gemmatimonadota bacterium]